MSDRDRWRSLEVCEGFFCDMGKSDVLRGGSMRKLEQATFEYRGRKERDLAAWVLSD